MILPRPLKIFNRPRKQHGAVLMVMLVIVVLGAAAILVNSLSSTGLRIERDKITVDALVQAKEALIGMALTYSDYPGGLPCPDTNNDGEANAGGTTGCPQYIGRLPWKTMGLPDLRDSAGERLWYTLSRNVRRYDSVRPLNSETTGTLNITGTYTANNLMAIVFAPGSPLQTQSRSATQTAPCTTTDTPPSTEFENMCATNYLEGSNANLSKEANPVAGINPNQSYQNANAAIPFNDQLIFITHDQLFPLVEKRIAREVKSCLDSYAGAHANTYPWAVPVTDDNYAGVTNTLFGRLPNSSDPLVSALLNALAELQLALNNYSAGDASTVIALLNAGIALETAAINAHGNQSILSSSVTNQVNQTGDKAQNLANLQGGVTKAEVQSEIDQANTNLAAVAIWPASCAIFSASNPYWADWKRLVFFQMADGYKPGGTGSCTPNINCLKINGADEYQAAVIVAGQQLTGAPARTNPDTTALPTPYLEGINAHTGTSPNIDFESYKPSDVQYQAVNDLVLCLNGTGNCPP